MDQQGDGRNFPRRKRLGYRRRYTRIFKYFYLATAAFSNVYCLSNHIVLYNIFEITVFFFRYHTNALLRSIVQKIEAKFLKYYTKIPMLYWFSIILDPRLRL